MARKKTTDSDMMKKSNALLMAFIALGAGFMAGIVFSAYKSAPGVSMRPAAPNQQAAAEPQITQDQARQILALEKEVEQNPGNADTWTRLGNLYFDTGNFENAIRTYEKSLALNPRNADVQTDLGVMYRRAGKPEEAIKAFNRAIEIDPKHEVSRFNKGIVLLHDLNDKEGAIQAWENLLEINPAAMAPNGQPLRELVNRFKQAGS